MPSLIVQTHVMIDEEEFVSWVQVICIIATSLQGLADLLHFFKYVSLSNETYFIMMCKAVYNTMTRTALVAYLVGRLKAYVYVWVLVSYGLGFLIYFGSVVAARRRKRDDPLEFKIVHFVFGNLIAQHMCFISFPFAPNHSIADWWGGYLASEVKIVLENVCMVGAVAALWTGEHDLLFNMALFFAGTAFIVNLYTLVYLHRSVSKQLKRRNLYSSSLIVKLFAYICAHIKEGLKRKKAQKEGLDMDEGGDESDGDDGQVQRKSVNPNPAPGQAPMQARA
jgi:hypothetical protein